MTPQMKRLELYDGTSVVINVAQVTWLKVRDARTTRVHFAGTNTIHVKGSVTEVAMRLSGAVQDRSTLRMVPA